MCKAEATNTLLATLREYDALWDGELFPEIIDAEFHDGDPEQTTAVSISWEMFACYDRQLSELLERLEALAALMSAVSARVEDSLDVPLFQLEIDGELYDCPLDGDTFFECYVAPDLK